MQSDVVLVLTAPLSGVLVPITDVPDPVFAARMVGDGVSIDPTSQTLLAPCAGKVTVLHPAAHALTVTHDSGVEVMMHVGLDTVGLKGKGFKPLVKVGDAVASGAPLIEFDADLVAQEARSLLTQVVITNGDRVASMVAAAGTVEAGRDRVLTVHVAAGASETVQRPSQEAIQSDAVEVPNLLGLHARPAAVLVSLARRFRSDVEIVRGKDHANAKSVVAIMTLQVQKGERVRIRAAGPDAVEALRVLAEAVAEGLNEKDEHAPVAPVPAGDHEVGADEPGLLRGVSASPGLAVGRIFQMRRADIAVVETASDPAAERRSLEQALGQARAELDVLQQRLGTDASQGAIFAAHRELLEDPDLVEEAWRTVAQGKSAAFAWKRAYIAQADRLAGLRSELLAGRANDVRDVGERVLRLLTGQQRTPVEIPEGSLLVAEDLTPSDTASLDRRRVLGFATLLGGATSHVAILARSMDIPAIAAMDPRAGALADGTLAVLDGTRGRLRVDPSEAEVEEIRARLREADAKRVELLAAAAAPAVTKDGKVIEAAANIGDPAEAEAAVRMGADGVGLLRSEFLFLDRPSPPTEDEQASIYASIARALGPERSLIIRTLDVGGDKPLPYLPIGHEENPFLGERGIRVGLARPELLRTQFRAILRAAGLARLGVMLPMVATLSEFRQARTIFEEERAALGVGAVPLGIMVEVPSAALAAASFAREVDFFSVGTNDLTQYTMAVDRGHPKLASMADGLHPSVLKLIAMTVEAAHANDRWVGVCGGIAGDPQAIPVLVGLGVDELSVAVPALPAVKAAVRGLELGACRALAEKALQMDSAAAVRALTEVGA